MVRQDASMKAAPRCRAPKITPIKSLQLLHKDFKDFKWLFKKPTTQVNSFRY